jgi:type II secretory pathway component GspD/PulD (secretin)
MPAVAAPDKGESQRFSFSAQGAPLLTLLRQIADVADVSVISHSSLDAAKVAVEVKNAPVSEVLAAIARSLDRRLTRIGSIYFLGPVEPEDRGALVRKVRRLNAEELKALTELFKSEHGRAHVSGDGLVVVADRVEVLQRLSLTFDQVEAADTSSWVLQLVVVALGEHTRSTLGISTDMTAQFAAALATGAPSTDVASLTLRALLQSVHDSGDSRVVAQPLLLVRDGSTSTIRRGEDIRLAKRSTSPYGTSEVTGYEVIPTGLTITSTLRDDTSSASRLDLKLELSSISGYKDTLPIITTQGIESQTSLVTGGVYLLGSLEASSLSHSLGGSPLPLVYGRERVGYTLQVWAKAYRVAGPLALSQQSAAAAGPGEGPRPGSGNPRTDVEAAPLTIKGDGWKLVPPPVAAPTVPPSPTRAAQP